MTSIAAGPERISVEAECRAPARMPPCVPDRRPAPRHGVRKRSRGRCPESPSARELTSSLTLTRWIGTSSCLARSVAKRQRPLGRQRAIERGHDTPNWLGGHGMVAAAKKQRRGRSVPGDPVGDTAKQQPAATAGALGRHDDQIGVGRVVDDTFRGPSVSDASLDRPLRRTGPVPQPPRDIGPPPECPAAPQGRRVATGRAGREGRTPSSARPRRVPNRPVEPGCNRARSRRCAFRGWRRAQKDDGHPRLPQQFFGDASEHPARTALTVRRDHEHVTIDAGRDDGRGGRSRQDLP